MFPACVSVKDLLYISKNNNNLKIRKQKLSKKMDQVEQNKEPEINPHLYG